MASINGLSIRSLKSFRGHDGDGYYQGTLYLGNKKLGEWSQNAWCGPDIFSVSDMSCIKEIVKEYAKSSYVEDKYRDIVNEDILLHDITNLTLDEKEYKKYFRKGFKSVLKVTLGYTEYFLASIVDIKSLEQAKKVFNEYLVEIESKTGKKVNDNSMKLFSSLNDFVIEV